MRLSARQEKERCDRVHHPDWRPKSHLELFGPGIEDKPDMAEIIAKANARTKEIHATRAVMPPLPESLARVSKINMNDYDEDQQDEDPQIQDLIDDVQVNERRCVSPTSSPTKHDRKCIPSLLPHRTLLTRPGRGWKENPAAPIGESVAQKRQQEMTRIRASERTYDHLQAGGAVSAAARMSSDDTLDGSPEEKSPNHPRDCPRD
jgi:hypothetical protein